MQFDCNAMQFYNLIHEKMQSLTEKYSCQSGSFSTQMDHLFSPNCMSFGNIQFQVNEKVTFKKKKKDLSKGTYFGSFPDQLEISQSIQRE